MRLLSQKIQFTYCSVHTIQQKDGLLWGIKNNEEALWEDNSPYKYGDTQPAHRIHHLNESTLDVIRRIPVTGFLSFYRSVPVPGATSGSLQLPPLFFMDDWF